VIDAHLSDTATDGFPIAEVAQRSPLEPGEDAGPATASLRSSIQRRKASVSTTSITERL
jgi:hypothetical protein